MQVLKTRSEFPRAGETAGRCLPQAEQAVALGRARPDAHPQIVDAQQGAGVIGQLTPDFSLDDGSNDLVDDLGCWPRYREAMIGGFNECRRKVPFGIG